MMREISQNKVNRKKESSSLENFIVYIITVFLVLLLLVYVSNLDRRNQKNQGQSWDFTKVRQSSGLETIIDINETAKVIYEDNRFTAFNNGIVRDTKKGHEWIAGPDRSTSLSAAKNWVIKLNKDKFAGGRWRIPMIVELKTIEGPAKSLLKTTDRWVWSGENRDRSSVWFFLFDYNYVGFNSPNLRDHRLRALAVRSRKR